MANPKKKANVEWKTGSLNPRLNRESSSYLRSAVHQPVDWHTWGQDAFQAAKQKNKPILLDIGAVWCHWCHVMDHESYEDLALARFINEHFVPIKVDRDERPDVDVRYQKRVGALTGQGGWPLTGFLTPDGDLFYGGTYFPPREAHGRPSFRQVLERVSEVYQSRPTDLMDQAKRIEEGLRELRAKAPSKGGHLDEAWLNEAVEQVMQGHDVLHGGWGGAPKFPHPSALEFLIVRHERSPHQELGSLVETTLERMAKGGMYDQLEGGFHRYSVDAEWRVPHFEKMLYDNAELLRNYLYAWRAFEKPVYQEKAEEIARFLQNVLSDPKRGGFYGSQDADVDIGDDGDYFTWTLKELRDAVEEDPDLVRLLSLRFGIQEHGTLRHNPSKNVLRVAAEIEDLATGLGWPLKKVQAELKRGIDRLRRARQVRKSPFVDSVLYTNWNAMAIRAFLEFGARLERPQAQAFALRSLNRLLENAYHPERGFSHTVGGKALWGFLDDNAQMLPTLCTAFNHTQELRHLETAKQVADLLLSEFWDSQRQGFRDVARTVHDHGGIRMLAQSELSIQDAPSPSSNARAVEGLFMASHLLGEERYRNHAREFLEAHAEEAKHLGIFGAAVLSSVQQLVSPSPHVILAGPSNDPRLQKLHQTVLAHGPPGTTVHVILPGAFPPGTPPEAVAFSQGPARKKTQALVCWKNRCLPPIEEPEKLASALKEDRSA